MAGDHGELQLKLESHLPKTVPADRATAIFCYGYCFHPWLRIASVELIAAGAAHPAAAYGMPRRDLFEWLQTTGADPTGASYHSGFWGVVPVPAQGVTGTLAIEAGVRFENGEHRRAVLGEIAIVAAAAGRDLDPCAEAMAPRVSSDTIAVCMATFEPDPELFATQVRSLQAQTDDRWICVISDGGSSDEALSSIAAVIEGDSRFELSRSPKRLAPYWNFERALALAPAGSQLLAPCDQDDNWYPDKLASLRSALGAAQLVFCDQRLIDRRGGVIRDSLWRGRRNDHSNLASLLVANAIPGAAMLLRRRVVELALPFPDAPGVPYHDHWLALVALSAGDIAYVPRALYDYVQHTGAVSGDLVQPTISNAPLRVPLRESRGWRSAYFGGYVMREVFALTLLLRCASTLTARKRRALQWFVDARRSPSAFAWLALRPLRRLIGRDETLGGEAPLVAGLAWPWLLKRATARAQHPGNRAYDASFPDPPAFEQRRLRRWRAGT